MHFCFVPFSQLHRVTSDAPPSGLCLLQDDLVGQIGARPSLLWLFFIDCPLFQRVLWGPVSSYQYRLMGPGKWDGARRAIFTQFDRMKQPLKTRKVQDELLTTILHFAKLFHAANVLFRLNHNFPINLCQQGGGGKTVHSRPLVKVEPDFHGSNCLHLLHPCAQPEHDP